MEPQREFCDKCQSDRDCLRLYTCFVICWNCDSVKRDSDECNDSCYSYNELLKYKDSILARFKECRESVVHLGPFGLTLSEPYISYIGNSNSSVNVSQRPL